jgi:DNA-binding protein HU-beta
VAISGFGTFQRATRAARTGRNPRTGEALEIAEANVPRFSALKGFKDAVRGSE